MATKTVTDFDLDRYLRASKKLDLSELDWMRSAPRAWTAT